MAGSTTRGVAYPDSSDTYPVTPWWKKLAQSVDDAITSAVQGLASQSDLAGKANVSHTHDETDVNGLTDDLAGKAAKSHTHVMADITDAPSMAAGSQDLVGSQDATGTSGGLVAGSGWSIGSLRVQRLGKRHALLTGRVTANTDQTTGGGTLATLPAWAVPASLQGGVAVTDEPTYRAVRISVGTAGLVGGYFNSTTLASGKSVYVSLVYPLD